MNKRHDGPRQALGRGLSTLLPRRPAVVTNAEAALENQQASTADATSPASESLATQSLPAPIGPRVDAPPQELPQELSVESLEPNPYQPRRTFRPETLEELAASIREQGIIQPLVVRKLGDRYQIVAGERRWRASKLIGLEKVPVVVRDYPDTRMLEFALVENIQREELDPIETARAFQQLEEMFQLTAEQIGKMTGKDRSTVTNYLRLLKLPEDAQRNIALGILTPGHARALLMVTDQVLQAETARNIIASHWSVRQTEEHVRNLLKPRSLQDKVSNAKSKSTEDANVRAAIDAMEQALGTRIRILPRARGRGAIEIEYYSPEDLDRIYTAIVGEPE